MIVGRVGPQPKTAIRINIKRQDFIILSAGVLSNGNRKADKRRFLSAEPKADLTGRLLLVNNVAVVDDANVHPNNRVDCERCELN